MSCDLISLPNREDQLGNVRTEEASGVYCINLAVYLIKGRAGGEDVGCKAMRL